MYVCMYVCMYYTYIHIYVCVCRPVHVCIFVSVHVPSIPNHMCIIHVANNLFYAI